MTPRIIKHDAVPQCGSSKFALRTAAKSKFFYWDDLPSRRLRPEILTREAALEAAKRWHGRSGIKMVERLRRG
jgi:hypothetical protein